MLRPDVVVLSNDLVGALEVRKALPQVKVAVWVHNECHSGGDIPSGLAATDVFLSCSGYIQDWLSKRHGVSKERIRVAYAGVDKDVFFPSARSIRVGLKLLYVGRLDPNKGVDLAVEALKKLKELDLPVSLTVAGHSWFYRRSGVEEDSFLRRLRGAMKETQVDWLGHVPRRWIPSVMREHDVALVISRSQEPFGLVVLEAMASGLAVMASSHGGLREACGKAGIFVDPENDEQIIQKLRSLCDNKEELEEWKQRSLVRAEAFHWRQTAGVLLTAVGAGRIAGSEMLLEVN
jgi:glycosyltransferase involved in cell wall biosynthesis